MFGLIGDVLKGVSVITGSVLGFSLSVIATTLGITKAMVQEALDAGCKTYEEIREYHNIDQ